MMEFTNSKLVNYTRISPNKTENRNHAIDTITIHCVVGQVSVQSLGAVFATENRKASSNYGIGYDGSIGMYVEEKDRSWCTSSRSNDHRAITIEVASDTTEPYSVNSKAYASLINLVTDICERNNIKELKWKADKTLIGQVDKQNMTVHRWFAQTKCPGEYLYTRMGDIAVEVNKRLRGVKVGDRVRLSPNAVYVNGKNVPSEVKNKEWIVKKVNGEIAIIDKSTDGKNSINSAINLKYLTVNNVSSEEVVSAPGSSSYPTVKYGDNSIHVKKAQEYLNKWGASITVDGAFGNATLAAVKNFQKFKGLDMDGIVGPKTWRALAEEFKSYTVQVTATALNVRNGPGTNHAINACIRDKGVYTIIAESYGTGSNAGWGKLKSEAGWISLDHTKKI